MSRVCFKDTFSPHLNVFLSRLAHKHINIVMSTFLSPRSGRQHL